jgi:hypothetical protein
MFDFEIAKTKFSSSRTRSQLQVVCEGLLFNIFRKRPDGNKRGLAVAFVSPHRSAGVSEVVKTLAKGLSRDREQLAISVSCRSLIQRVHGADGLVDPNSDGERRGQEAAGSDNEENNWHAAEAALTCAIGRLRARYLYVLIDCAPINETQDAVRVASLVDGIVLVVEANRTKKDQILYAERSIESAKGRVLGHVLNKRTYPIPAWFHRVMTAAGI